ncbi:hypothetical protein Q5P01_007295 [Channa striata]|uniref:Uncharacterized protein n=1 Tax=Channa striata TaxID=64152 RepID=A0AA88STM3_CHASR|nr:hypothetical protein Q5P01_007295 [Channa striata]
MVPIHMRAAVQLLARPPLQGASSFLFRRVSEGRRREERGREEDAGGGETLSRWEEDDGNCWFRWILSLSRHTTGGLSPLVFSADGYAEPLRRASTHRPDLTPSCGRAGRFGLRQGTLALPKATREL